MKLQIEDWARDNLSDNARDIFKEALTCYTVGAYKSAFIMSYLAFKVTIRDRIIISEQYPDAYEENEWNIEIKKKLEDDDVWEKLINSIVEVNPAKNAKMASILDFDDRYNMVNKFIYWKNIRNSCAHAKRESINNSTVEQFWNYLYDNLSEFYVLGGKKYLLNELCNSYKYRVTNEYKEELPNILKNINSVYGNKTKECIDQFIKLNKITHLGNEEVDVEFWGKFINNNMQDIREGLVYSLMNNVICFVQCYRMYPQILPIAYKLDEKFIKNKVNEWLLYESTSKEPYWNLMCDLLRICPELLEIDKITSQNVPHDVSKINFNENQRFLLDKYEVFNKYLDGSYDYFFKVEFEDIKNHNGTDEENAKLWFEYIKWNREYIEKLSYSIRRLDERINNSYKVWESERLKHFEDIIRNYKQEIKDIINEEKIEVCDKMKSWL